MAESDEGNSRREVVMNWSPTMTRRVRSVSLHFVGDCVYGWNLCVFYSAPQLGGKDRAATLNANDLPLATHCAQGGGKVGSDDEARESPATAPLPPGKHRVEKKLKRKRL